MSKLKLGVAILAVGTIYALSAVWYWALNGMSGDIAVAHVATVTVLGTIAFTIIMGEVG